MLAAHYIVNIRGSGSLAVQIHDLCSYSVNIREKVDTVLRMRESFENARSIAVFIVDDEQMSRRHFNDVQHR